MQFLPALVAVAGETFHLGLRFLAHPGQLHAVLLMADAQVAQAGGAAFFLLFLVGQQLGQTIDKRGQRGFGVLQKGLGGGYVFFGDSGGGLRAQPVLIGAGDDGGQIVRDAAATVHSLLLGGGQAFLSLIPVQLHDLQIELGFVRLIAGGIGPGLGLIIGLLSVLPKQALFFHQGLGGSGGLHQRILGVTQQVGAFGMDGFPHLGGVFHQAGGGAGRLTSRSFLGDGGLYLLIAVIQLLLDLFQRAGGGFVFRHRVIVSRALLLQGVAQAVEFFFDVGQLLFLVSPSRVHAAQSVLLYPAGLFFGGLAVGQRAFIIGLGRFHLGLGRSPILFQAGDIDVDGLDGHVDILLAGRQFGGGGLLMQLLQTGTLGHAAVGGGQQVFHVGQTGLFFFTALVQGLQPVIQAQGFRLGLVNVAAAFGHQLAQHLFAGIAFRFGDGVFYRLIRGFQTVQSAFHFLADALLFVITALRPFIGLLQHVAGLVEDVRSVVAGRVAQVAGLLDHAFQRTGRQMSVVFLGLGQSQPLLCGLTDLQQRFLGAGGRFHSFIGLLPFHSAGAELLFRKYHCVIQSGGAFRGQLVDVSPALFQKSCAALVALFVDGIIHGPVLPDNSSNGSERDQKRMIILIIIINYI